METEFCKVVEMPVAQAPIPTYTEEEHGTWQLLYETQEQLVPSRACHEFQEGLAVIKFPRNRIPLLKDVSATIEKSTGWKLLRVDGLVHPRDFFKLLAKRVFPSTDFIRKRTELKYTPAPDMFHDLFGHAPLLTNKDFTKFFEEFGKIGVEAAKKFPETHEVHEMLPRMYWFTVEFGLIKNSTGLRAYGSGTVSSPEELEFALGPDCKKHPFKVDDITHKHYDIWHLQKEVFVVDSFEQLYKEFREWAKSMNILPSR